MLQAQRPAASPEPFQRCCADAAQQRTTKTKATMKNLLIPIDFSENSRNAFRYAAAFSQLTGIEHARLLHVFTPEATGEADFIPPVAALMKAREEMLEGFVKDMAEEIGPFPFLAQTELSVGFPADEITAQSEEHDLVIMGTTGDGGLLEKVFGSVSSSVSQRSACPVLLVPPQAAFSGIRHIVYASSYESGDAAVIEKLMAFNAPFKACLHFVHVQDGKGKSLPDPANRNIFEELFEKGDPGFSFEMAEVESESLDKGLDNYAQQCQAELMVMVTKPRGFWANIMHRSATKQIVLHAQRPVLVLHLED